MKDFDGGGGATGVDELVQKGVGHGVIVAVAVDVGIDIDPGVDGPLAEDEGLGGQGAQGGLVQLDEGAASAGDRRA
jgi:hypothetical protein